MKQMYITDMQSPTELRNAVTNFIEMVVPRYGVWSIATGEVIETGDNLSELLDKYHLTQQDVYKIKQ